MDNYNNQNPQYGQPAQPQYDPNAQQYAQPAQPQYAQPAQPQYDPNAQQYAQPQYAQPQYDPNAQQYAQPQYAQPQYDPNAQQYAQYAQPAAAPAANAKKGILAPFLVSLIGAVSMFLSLFFPFFSVGGFGASYSFSLFDFFGADYQLTSLVGGDDDVAIFVVFVVILLIFFALSILFAALKKPIPAMIFTIISTLIFAFLNLAFSIAFDSMGMLGGAFSFGFGLYFFYIAAAAAFAGSIWLIVARNKAKAAAQAAPVMPY